MPAIIFALISYLGWGIGILFEAIAVRKLETYSATFLGLILSLLVTTLYTPFALSDLGNLTPNVLLINLLVAFFWIFGTVTYYEGLKNANPALVGTIASAFPAIVVPLSILFLQEKINLNQTFAIILILSGILLCTLNLKDVLKRKTNISLGVILGVITMISWGIAFTFIKIPVSAIGWFWPNYFVFLSSPLLLAYMKVRGIKFVDPRKSGVLIILLLSIILVRIAEFSYNLGISKGLVVVVAPIAGANPTLFIVLAFLIFKDPITRQQIAGIITTLIGIVLLSVFSV